MTTTIKSNLQLLSVCKATETVNSWYNKTKLLSQQEVAEMFARKGKIVKQMRLDLENDEKLNTQALELGIPVNVDFYWQFDLEDRITMINKTRQYDMTIKGDLKDWIKSDWEDLAQRIDEYEILLEKAEAIGFEDIDRYTGDDLYSLADKIEEKIQEINFNSRYEYYSSMQDKFY
jgi:hypothetical protein